MEMLVEREPSSEWNTIGKLFVPITAFHCYTLEDIVRAPGVKVDHQTAIPAGRYEVILSKSPRFGRILPEILNVPMFTAVRMHGGNDENDTEGCILCGMERGETDGKPIIHNCAPAISEIIRLLSIAEKIEKSFITIR